MCHIPFTFNVYGVIVISEGGEDSGGVKGDTAAKLVTAVRVCVFFFFNFKCDTTFFFCKETA